MAKEEVNAPKEETTEVAAMEEKTPVAEVAVVAAEEPASEEAPKEEAPKEEPKQEDGKADEARVSAALSLLDKMENALKDNPEMTMAILTWADKGGSLPALMREYMGDEALSMKEGDEGYEDWVQAGEKRKKDFQEKEDLVKEIMKNSQESSDRFSKFKKDNEMSDEDGDSFWSYINEDIEALSRGVLSDSFINKLKRSYDYDRDMAAAKEQGAVDGRNENIEAQERKMRGSGLPNVNETGSASEEVKEKKNNATADWLSGMSRRR